MIARLGTAAVGAHALVVLLHGIAHRRLGVELGPWQQAFAGAVIVLAPLAAAVLLWTRRRRLGCWLLLASMAGSLLFGLYHHYVAVSPDHVAHLPAGEAQGLFRWTAALLPVAESLGLLVAFAGLAGPGSSGPMAIFLLRLVAGLVFLQAGGLKLFDWFGGVPAEHGGHPAAWSLVWIAGVLEVYGGAAMMLGLFTRPVAFILSGMMAVAYFMFHQPGGPWPIQNEGLPAVLLCFIFLFFAARGAGDWSVDAWWRRRAERSRRW